MNTPHQCHGCQNENLDIGAGCLGTADDTVNRMPEKKQNIKIVHRPNVSAFDYLTINISLD